MEKDIIRIMKGFEKEFLGENRDLYSSDRMEFLKQREEFVDKKLEEMKKEDGSEE